MYEIVTTEECKKQFERLEYETQDRLEKKIVLLKTNPARFPHRSYPHHFRIRFTDHAKEKRLIYRIEKDAVILLFITDREKEYKDLEKYLSSRLRS